MKETSLIVWDESTTANRAGIKALDRTLRDLRNKDYPSDERRDGLVCRRH